MKISLRKSRRRVTGDGGLLVHDEWYHVVHGTSGVDRENVSNDEVSPLLHM